MGGNSAVGVAGLEVSTRRGTWEAANRDRGESIRPAAARDLVSVPTGGTESEVEIVVHPPAKTARHKPLDSRSFRQKVLSTTAFPQGTTGSTTLPMGRDVSFVSVLRGEQLHSFISCRSAIETSEVAPNFSRNDATRRRNSKLRRDWGRRPGNQRPTGPISSSPTSRSYAA
jgi:hypothetical protein